MQNTIYHHRSLNITRTWLFMLVYAGILVGLGYLLAQTTGYVVILYVSVGLSLAMNIIGYWFSHKIAIKSTGAKPASQQQYPDLHAMVQHLSSAAGIKKPAVYIIPDQSPNAFATGRNQNTAAVAVTQGLLQTLDRQELEGVIAHELAHIGNRDILISTIAVVLAGSIAIVADLLTRSLIFAGGESSDRGINPLMIIISIVVAILAPLIAMVLRLAVSRRREYLADATGAMITQNPYGLASALEKIHAHTQRQPMNRRRASTATAHMFIANPFGATRRGLQRLFSTHPPAEDRIQRLRSMLM